MSVRRRPPTAPTPVRSRVGESPVQKDAAYSDPVMKLFEPDHNLGEHAVDASWFGGERRREPEVRITPRVESYSIDVYKMARENLYTFERSELQPRVRFTQTRNDLDRLGQIDAPGARRISVYQVEWHNRGGGNVDYTIFGSDVRDEKVRNVATGYVKKTDVKGRLDWVVVVTKLLERDILLQSSSPPPQLFSLPLFEAMATGVAFALFDDDPKIRELFPTLAQSERNDSGTRGRRVVDDIGANFNDTINGVGPQRWTDTVALDNNSAVAGTVYTPVDAVDGGRPWAMKVSPAPDVGAVGAIFPLRQTKKVNALRDGVTIDHLIIHEVPVKFTGYELDNVSRYSVELFATVDAIAPTATIEVVPVATETDGGQLLLKKHISRPKIGTRWAVADVESFVVDEADVARAMTSAPGWDPRLHSTIESAMLELRKRLGGTTVSITA